ncbi:MAG: hypothetical protein Q9160_006470 [Pyrenula sp. 1 TL-2023]
MAIQGQVSNRKSVFDSVFPPAKVNDLAPTPSVTPQLGSSSPGQAFGASFYSSATPSARGIPQNESYPEQVIWDRSWHAATTYLTLPGDAVKLDEHALQSLCKARYLSPGSEVLDAIRYVLSPSSTGRQSRQGKVEYDLLEWYLNEVRQHFLTSVKPAVLKALQCDGEPSDILDGISSMIDKSQNLYTLPFTVRILPEVPEGDKHRTSISFRHAVTALAIHGLPQEKLDHLMTETLSVCGRTILGIEDEDYELVKIMPSTHPDRSAQDTKLLYKTFYQECPDVQWDWLGDLSQGTRERPDSVNATREFLFQLLGRFNRNGLGQDRTQKLLANVLHDLMARFVDWAYAEIYDGEADIVSHLKFWVENIFARFVVQILSNLDNTDAGLSKTQKAVIDLSDMMKWQEMAISRLGALRVRELFDIVVAWDQTKRGILDLKHYITNPATRAYLTNRFTGALTTRLLHPGASTIEILQLYISIIRAFRELDPRGVLLDRVARPIRRYLRERDDAVKVIVGGLLSDVPEQGEADSEQPSITNSDVLSELAIELNEQKFETHSGGTGAATATTTAIDDEGDLDWNNMDWVPDPIDAAPDYKKSKNTDVIGSLISLLETKEIFVKEFQTNLADRLLKPTRYFEHETKVIEHLKVRFGDAALQACDVMLKDVTESRRYENSIREDEEKKRGQKEASAATTKPTFHAKILSRLFWPPLLDQPFNIPEPVSKLQQRYQVGFSAVKQSRKLTWLNNLGHVTVELDLEDRIVTEENVLSWQATVIYAFHSPDTEDGDESRNSNSNKPVTKTVTDLAETLNMSPALVRSACLFWLAKQVLASPSPDTYLVLETLPEPTSPTATTAVATPSHPHPSAPAAAAAASLAIEQQAQAAAAKAEEVATLDRMLATYRPFIVSMLTNQGGLPLPRIAMMLGMVVQGGFPHSNEELRAMLARLASEGEVEGPLGGGGVYRAVRG